jgi:predicted ATPase/DNA-binding CsgD family transcriptional regulator
MRMVRETAGEYRWSAPGAGTLFGRDELRRVVAGELTNSAARLVTLIGVGGVGKTRLAQAVLAETRDQFPGGAVFVPVAAIADPAGVLPEVGRALGLDPDVDDILAGIARTCGAGPTLFVLDNLEHLDVRSHVDALLASIPSAKVLATSRVALRIAGERVIPIEPFTVPDADQANLTHNPAVELFSARARWLTGAGSLLDADVAAIADICRRVDGIPLAIELAAGWSRVLSPVELNQHLDRRLDRLKDNRFSADPRHATMRATIAWSYERLDDAEQALFQRLSVFAGGFTLDMASRMAQGRAANAPYPYADGFGVPFGHAHYLGRDPTLEPADSTSLRHIGLDALEIDALDGLSSLIDHSLIQRREIDGGETRYAMFDTIREFGLERLAASGQETEVRHQLAVIMLAIFEAGTEGLYHADRLVFPPDRLHAAIPNFREAMRWLGEQGEAGVELAQRLAGVSWIFWQQSGRVAEGRQWLELAFRHPHPGWAYAAYLPALGFLAWIQGDDEAAERVLHEALLRTGEMGLTASEASAYLYLALVAWRKGPAAQNEMLLHLGRSIELYRSIDDPLGLGVCTQLFGVIAQASGNPDEALALQLDALGHYERCGYVWGEAAANLYVGGLLAQSHGGAEAGLPEGISHLLASYGLFSGMGDSWGMGAVLTVLGAVALHGGQLEPAGMMLGAAAELLRTGRSFLPPVNDALLGDSIAALRGAAGPEVGDQLLAAGATKTGPELSGLVTAFTDAILAPARSPRPIRLTRNQMELVRLLDQGLKPGQIAQRLDRHESSVYETLGRIQERLRVGKWDQIATAARANGLLPSS